MAAKRATPRKAGKTSLSLALDHVELASKGAANYAHYCMFSTGWLIGYDGIVGAGHRVEQDLLLAPHTESFRTAVARAGDPFSLTVMPDKTVVVRGDHFKATIPSFPLESMHNVQPDAPLVQVTEGLRNAMVEAARVTSNRNDRVIGASVMVKRSSVVGTDGGTILEAHHGMNLPGHFLVPREFTEALGKCKLMPTHIGWSDETLTVWFGPNAWMRSALYAEKYPDTDVIFASMLAQGVEWRAVPTDLLLALETLKPFLTPDKTVVLFNGGVCVCDPECKTFGASYVLPHHMETHRRALPFEGLRFAAMHGQWLAWTAEGIIWRGQVLRGATASR